MLFSSHNLFNIRIITVKILICPSSPPIHLNYFPILRHHTLLQGLRRPTSPILPLLSLAHRIAADPSSLGVNIPPHGPRLNHQPSVQNGRNSRI